MPLFWMDDASCAGLPTEIFFPIEGYQSKAPLEICSACPVIEECKLFATENKEQYGIWGGEVRNGRRLSEDTPLF